jgi:hypothetical protein
MEIAQSALLQEKGIPNNYQAWYVSVGEHRVAPKWLVSQLTNLSVSEFTTSEARRLLAQLGVEVKRK